MGAVIRDNAQPMKTLLLCALALAAAPSAMAAEAIRFDENQIAWSPAPPTLPTGAEIAVLEGNPRAPGLFTMRVKLPPGARLLPHWHPKPERVTVLSGVIGIGFGEVFDGARLRSFGPGSYYVTPPETLHFGLCLEETVLQVTTDGPWELRLATEQRKTP